MQGNRSGTGWQRHRVAPARPALPARPRRTPSKLGLAAVRTGPPFPDSYLRETVIQVFSDVCENQTQPGPCRPASFSLGTAAARHRGSPQPWAGPAVSAWLFLQNCHEAFEPPLCSETLFPFVLVDESISF